MVSKSSSRVTQQRRVTARECGNSRVKTLKALGRSPLYFGSMASRSRKLRVRSTILWQELDVGPNFASGCSRAALLANQVGKMCAKLLQELELRFKMSKTPACSERFFGDEVGKMRKRARLHETNVNK